MGEFIWKVVWKININLDSLNNKSLENELEDALNKEELTDELKDVLEKAELTLKLSLQDANTIHVEPIKNELKIENKLTFEKANKVVNESKEETKTPFWKKFLVSSYKVFEEFFDSMAKKFLKEKYKLNYSVYNDGKKAITALKNNDIKTFLTKGTDSILYTLKKIPANVKKVIKSTKNVAIDEVFSWKEWMRAVS